MSNLFQKQSQIDQKTLPNENERRRQVIRETLGDVLTNNQMAQAISLCDREFPEDQLFSSASFFGKLVAEFPELNLTRTARLNLLRAMRQQAQEQGVDTKTQGFQVPHKLLEATPQRLTSDARDSSTSYSTSSSSLTPPKRLPDVVPPPLGSSKCGDNGQPGIPVEISKVDRPGLRLPGHYWARLEDRPTGAMTVTYVTSVALFFDADHTHDIKMGDRLSVEFTLNDAKATTVWQRVEIRSVTSNAIEAVWSNPESLENDFYNYVSYFLQEESSITQNMTTRSQ